MNVFKFGGASVKDAQGIKNVVNIIKQFQDHKIVVVVSAMGKTTNELELVARDYFQHRDSCISHLNLIKQKHLQAINDLNLQHTDLINEINDLFVEIEWIIEEELKNSFDYIYDQIVSVGELVSSRILHKAIESENISAVWYDIRGGLITDDTHRDAKVEWDSTASRLKVQIEKNHSNADVIVTQGFIGSTIDNETTTLGREGSDYTAAIISYSCDVEAMHIWKDVPGVLTADPKRFPDAQLLKELTYNEAIEMTYYGAKVIHPKTIKPLQNKGIVLYVRPFDDLNSLGTKIGEDKEIAYPPIIVVEDGQALVHISVNDFSFVAEHHLSQIFKLLSDLRIKVNMMKNTAISFTLCVLYDEEKLAKLKQKLDEHLDVSIINNIQLYTIRHFDKETINRVIGDREILFEDMHKNSVQMAVKQSEN